MHEQRPNEQCAAFGCENKRSEGQFVGEYCGPCDSALRYGTATYGTSFVFQQQLKIEELRAAINSALKLFSSNRPASALDVLTNALLGTTNER